MAHLSILKASSNLSPRPLSHHQFPLLGSSLSASLSQTEASLFTISHYLSYTYHLGSATVDWASLIAQLVTNLPAMQEILV